MLGLKIAKGVTIFRPSYFRKGLQDLDPTPVFVADQKAFIAEGAGGYHF